LTRNVAQPLRREEFTHAPVLTHWVPDVQIIVETDASDYALAAILSIHTTDGDIHPVAFHSCSFNSAELNYDTHDKELLAIFEVFKHWRQYLKGSGTPVDVITDHKNLEYFPTMELLTHQQACWSEFLSQYHIHGTPLIIIPSAVSLISYWLPSYSIFLILTHINSSMTH
jgi:hypothetical protein